MSRFRSQFEKAGAPSLVAQFGEDVVYYKRGLGCGRPVKAIVRRNVSVPTDTGQVAQAIFVDFIDSETLGVSALEIDDSRDVLEVAIVQGGARQRRQLTRVIDDSNAMVRTQVR